MTVYTNIKRPVFKGFNTIWSLLTEESRPPEESESSHFVCDKRAKSIVCSSTFFSLNFALINNGPLFDLK